MYMYLESNRFSTADKQQHRNEISAAFDKQCQHRWKFNTNSIPYDIVIVDTICWNHFISPRITRKIIKRTTNQNGTSNLILYFYPYQSWNWEYQQCVCLLKDWKINLIRAVIGALILCRLKAKAFDRWSDWMYLYLVSFMNAETLAFNRKKAATISTERTLVTNANRTAQFSQYSIISLCGSLFWYIHTISDGSISSM